MEFKLKKVVSTFDVKYLGCDYIIQEHREGDEKMYSVERKDGKTINKQEGDTLIEQFKLEQ